MGENMQEKMLEKLEFNKIVQNLSEECFTILGKELAKKLRPSNNLHEVKLWQKETSQAVEMITTKGYPPFDGIKDIRHSISKLLKGYVLEQKELLDIAYTLQASRNLKSYYQKKELPSLCNKKSQFNIIEPLFESLYTNKTVEDKIFSCILNEEEISDTASPQLFSIRRQIHDAEQKIKEKLNQLLHSPTLQKYLQEHIITIRSGRYVLPIKQEYRHNFPGLVHDSSASGATLFIEPMEIVEINNTIKQLKIKENLEIEKILTELTKIVGNIQTELENTLQILAKLDFIFAKARLSLKMNAIQPYLNQNGYFNIKKGRHPLLNPSKVVPIDIYCGDKFNILIITGPNTGGKTVTLKTVGLLTLMAQAGLHIPAGEGTEINVFENIFADIGDEQSIEQNLSTFSFHMTNIISILENVNSNSLVLLDELGSGTDPVEGSAIAIAILEYLHKNNVKTIVTTHYSKLKLFAIDNPGIENASCEFDVETLKPTYRLLIGIPGRSNAFIISQKLGLNETIINRAKELISQENIKFEDIISSIEKNRLDSEKLLEEITLMKKECEQLKKELEFQENRLKLQKENILRKAHEEAKIIIEKAKKEAEQILKEIKNLAKEQNISEINRKGESLLNKLRQELKKAEENLREPLFTPDETNFEYNFKIGDTVYITSLKQEGIVTSNSDENKNIQVQVGAIKLTLPISQVKPINQSKIPTEKIKIDKEISLKAKYISPEIHVRHQTLAEAIENIDKYLDDAYLAGLKTVTIIHGKGTGKLRSGIHQFLKTHPHVKSFRLGTYGEGEHGVTIVELDQ